MMKVLLIGLILCVLTALACSSVRIETGASTEERVESSESQASHLRSEWAQRIRAVEPKQVARLLADHFEQTTGVYFRFSDEVIKRWQEGETGRNQLIDDTEMRQFVDAWITTQKPVLQAYDDNLEYGFQQMRLSKYFSSDFLGQTKQLLDVYYRVYSAVFLPQGTVADYQYRVGEASTEADRELEIYRKELENN